MSTEETELLARNTYRRMTRYNRHRVIQSIKALIIWLVAITFNIAVIHAAIDALWTSWPMLCALLILVVTVSLAYQIDELTQNILKVKNPPRNRHSRRGHR
ncbi:MAG TPA: hypothetical protein DDW34_12905 [Clostridium sp.]|nr:hypothetical protein [Clostridium sp.]